MNAWFYNSKDFEKEAKLTRPNQTPKRKKKVNELEQSKTYIKTNKNKKMSITKASEL